MRIMLLALFMLVIAGCNRVDPPGQDTSGAAAPAQVAAVVLASENFATNAAASSACNLESIAGQQIVDSSEINADSRALDVSGWLIDESSSRAPSEISLGVSQVGGKGAAWGAVLPLTVARPDVQAARGGAAGLLNSGFRAALDASALPAGRYALTLHYRNGAGVEVVCDNGRIVILK